MKGGFVLQLMVSEALVKIWIRNKRLDKLEEYGIPYEGNKLISEKNPEPTKPFRSRRHTLDRPNKSKPITLRLSQKNWEFVQQFPNKTKIIEIALSRFVEGYNPEEVL